MKTVLKHIVDGNVFTRQTARAYTHVVLAKTSVYASLQHIAKQRASCVKQAKENAEFYWDNAQYNSTHAVGDVSFSGRYIVTQRYKEEAVKFLAEFGSLTRDQYIAQQLQEERDRLETKIMALMMTDHKWVVCAWSGSLSNAQKAAANFTLDHTRVEAINNGVTA